MKAVVYLELATRSGEAAAAHVKNIILQQISTTTRNHVMVLADSHCALSSSHRVLQNQRFVNCQMITHFL